MIGNWTVGRPGDEAREKYFIPYTESISDVFPVCVHDPSYNKHTQETNHHVRALSSIYRDQGIFVFTECIIW